VALARAELAVLAEEVRNDDVRQAMSSLPISLIRSVAMSRSAFGCMADFRVLETPATTKAIRTSRKWRRWDAVGQRLSRGLDARGVE
jgi:hypothetical protein